MQAVNLVIEAIGFGVVWSFYTYELGSKRFRVVELISLST